MVRLFLVSCTWVGESLEGEYLKSPIFPDCQIAPFRKGTVRTVLYQSYCTSSKIQYRVQKFKLEHVLQYSYNYALKLYFNNSGFTSGENSAMAVAEICIEVLIVKNCRRIYAKKVVSII